jgi:drug/metabolite transporter (DMT)-like permease
MCIPIYGAITGLRMLCYYGAVRLLPLAEATVITSTTPMFSLIMSKAGMGTPIRPLQVIHIQ